MDFPNCVICGYALKDDAVTVGAKGLKKLITVSANREDGKFCDLSAEGVCLHVKCRATYTNERCTLAAMKRNESNEETSQQAIFDYQKQCLFCGDDASEQFVNNEKKKPIMKRSVVCKVMKNETGKNIISSSFDHTDQKREEVRTRVQDVDLVAVNARYHQHCYSKFLLPKRSTGLKRGRPRSSNMKLNGKCVRLFTDRHLENIGSMFKTLYKDELLTDCTLYCKNGSIKAHKLILAASSPYFRKVFLEHNEEHAIFIMHGVSVGQLQDLLELIYKGSIDVPGETLNSVFDLAEDLQVTGVLVEESSDSRYNGYGRDTRFKGQKRVAVNFTADENDSVPAKIVKNTFERLSSSGSEKGSIIKKSPENHGEQDSDDVPEMKIEDSNNDSTTETSNTERFMGHSVDDPSNLSVWARKERKFKCDLCPSSFKRASHLTRHQLVHTGERPFACSQCDKAFSRHDKLKHHIHKAHELGPLNDSLPPDSLYTIGHVRILTPEQSMIESPEPIVQNPETSNNSLSAPQKKGRGRPRKYPIEPVVEPSEIVQNPFCGPQKKGRGRPRKYPIVPPPLIKRPRGRPRLNPIVPQDTVKRENYDISNMPYGDLEYLTKPLHENNEVSEDMAIHDQGLMEPLVEIKTEPAERSEPEQEEHGHSATFLENIGLFENSAIAKIGECTISVANNSGSN